MYPKQLKDMISEGESSTIEFKRKIASPEKIAREIAAFANTIGGYLIIGVDDDGKIVGVESEKSVIDQVEKTCGFYLDPPVEPHIDIVQLQGRDLIVVYIDESLNKPHRLVTEATVKKSDQRAYIRVGEKSMIASPEMTRVLSGQNANAKPITLSIGDKEKRLFTYLEKNERATVKDFSRLVNISIRRAERLLVRLVRAGVLQIHIDSESDYFTLVERIRG